MIFLLFRLPEQKILNVILLTHQHCTLKIDPLHGFFNHDTQSLYSLQKKDHPIMMILVVFLFVNTN